MIMSLVGNRAGYKTLNEGTIRRYCIVAYYKLLPKVKVLAPPQRCHTAQNGPERGDGVTHNENYKNDTKTAYKYKKI